MTTLPRLLLAAILVVLVAACSGGAAANITPPPGADASVTAKSGAFEPNRVDVPAGRAFELFFRNLDPAPHNVAIYRDASASGALFRGDVITNAAATYQVPALVSGGYFFRCDVHPEMTGAIIAS